MNKLETFGCLAALLLLPISVALNGWVLAMLWGWFIVPALGAPSLGVVPAIGISTVAHMLTHQEIDVETPSREYSETLIRTMVAAFGRPLVCLAFGWCVNLFA